MNNPAISVIIPCYNPPKFIKQCIKSVLCQSMKDFEVIVVDDGSTDSANLRCVEKMSKKDSRLRIIKNPHQGISQTRKDGYLQSNGEYIFFMDCDDFLPKDALKILYDAATSTGADVTIGDFACVVDSYGLIRLNVSNSQHEAAGKLIPKEDVLKVCYGPLINTIDDSVKMIVWGRLYKNNLIKLAIGKSDKDPFNPLKYLEDWWFNLLLMPYINSLYLTDDIVYNYRYGGVATTNAFNKDGDSVYFNCRFESFEKWNFSEGHPRTFACFAALLYAHLKSFILSEKYSKDEIKAFITERISSNKIVDWARNNMAQIEELPKHFKILVTENPEDIYCWYSNALHSKRSRIKRVRKKCALACSKVLDIIYETLY